MNLFRRIYELNNKSSSYFSKLVRKISLLSISIGLFSILISSFVLNGFKKEIKNKIYDFSGHYDVSSYSNGITFKNSPLELNEGFYSNYSDLNIIEDVFPYILNSALVQGKNESIEGVIFKGIEKKYLDNIKSHFDNFNDTKDFKSSVLISNYLSKKLKLDIDDTVTVFFPNDPPIFRKLKIKAIFSTGLEEIDKSIIYGEIGLSRKIYQWDNNKASGIHVFLNDFDEDDIVIDLLNKKTSFNEYVQSTNLKYIQIFDWLSLLDKNVIIFFIIILVVACFNMLSIVFIVIMEKTNLIGTLKSFGTPKKMIHSIFFNIGFKISIYGIVIGNLLSLLFYIVQEKYQLIKLNKENYYIDHVPVDYDLMVVLTINFILFFMILMSIYIPISFINKIKIIKSIKFS